MVRTKAANFRVWVSIDPDASSPTAVTFRPPATSQELANTSVAERTMRQEDAYNDHKMMKKLAYADYLDREIGLQVVHGFILVTIGKEHYQFIQDYQPQQARDILIVLRRRFLPTPRVEMNDIKKSWAKLMRRPLKGSVVVSWLDKCELSAIRGKELSVEMFKDEYSDTPVWHLVEAIEQIDHAWGTNVRLRFQSEKPDTPAEDRVTVKWLVEQFSDTYAIRMQSFRSSDKKFYRFPAKSRGESDNESGSEDGGEQESKKNSSRWKSKSQRTSDGSKNSKACKLCGQKSHELVASICGRTSDPGIIGLLRNGRPSQHVIIEP